MANTIRMAVIADDKSSNVVRGIREEYDRLGNTADSALTRVSSRLEAGRSSIGKFAAAGSQLALVGSTLGPGFESALGPLGEFVRVGGNAGLVISTMAELGPAAAASIAAVGEKAIASAASIESFAVAEAHAATNADLLLRAGTVLGPGFAAAASGVFDLKTNTELVDDALGKYGVTADGVAAQTKAMATAGATWQQQLEAERRATMGTADAEDILLAQKARDTIATLTLADATAKLNDAAGILPGHFGAIADSATRAKDWIDADSASAFELSQKMFASSGSVDGLAKSLDDLPRDISINIDVGLTGSGAGAFARGFPTTTTPAGNTDFAPTAGSTGSLSGTTADPEELARRRKAAADKAQSDREAAARKAQQAADEASRKAKQAAAEEQRAVGQKLGDAYNDMRDKAKRAFDDIHAAKLRDIEDTKNAANAVIDNAEKGLRATVSAAEAAVDNKRNQRREGELRADVAAATTPEDRRAALQALGDFLDDQRLAKLRSDTDSKIATLDSEKTKNETIATADKAREDKRYAAQKTAFDDDLKLLDRYLRDYVGKYDTAYAKIAGLGTKYHVPTGAKVAATTETPTGTKMAGGVASLPNGTHAPLGFSSGGAAPNVEVAVYLDSEQITAHVERRMARNHAAVSSGLH